MGAKSSISFHSMESTVTTRNEWQAACLKDLEQHLLVTTATSPPPPSKTAQAVTTQPIFPRDLNQLIVSYLTPGFVWYASRIHQEMHRVILHDEWLSRNLMVDRTVEVDREMLEWWINTGIRTEGLVQNMLIWDMKCNLERRLEPVDDDEDDMDGDVFAAAEDETTTTATTSVKKSAAANTEPPDFTASGQLYPIITSDNSELTRLLQLLHDLRDEEPSVSVLRRTTDTSRKRVAHVPNDSVADRPAWTEYWIQPTLYSRDAPRSSACEAVGVDWFPREPKPLHIAFGPYISAMRPKIPYSRQRK